MEMAPSPVQAVPSPSCVSESEVHASFGTTDFNTISKDYSESMDVSRDNLNESAESIVVENEADMQTGNSSPPSIPVHLVQGTTTYAGGVLSVSLIPSLKGTMTYAGGVVYCKGRWAMTDAAHDLEGQSSEFEFKLIKADDGCNLFPVNGKYQGWFSVKQPPPVKPIKIEDKEMMMKFTPSVYGGEGMFDVVGRGHNKLGKFNLRGKLTSGTGHIHIYREYYELAPLPLSAPKVRVRAPKSEKKDVAPKAPAVVPSSSAAPAIAPPSIKPEAPAVTPREGAGRIRKQSSLFKEFHDPLQKVSHTPKSQVAAKEKDTKQAAPVVAPPPVPQYPTVTSERTHRLNPTMKKCSDLLKELSKLHQAEWFLEPVDPIKFNIPDYPKVIKQPMDFSTIRKNIEAGAYDSINAFAEHVRLVFRNAITFNPARDSLVNIAAREVSNKFEDKFRMLITQLDPGALPAPELTRVSSTSSVGKATGIKRVKSKDYGSVTKLGRVSSAPGPRPVVNQFIPAAMDTSSIKIMEMQQMMQQMQEELYQLRASVRESELSKKLLETKDAAQNPLTFEEKKILVGQIHKLPEEKMEKVLLIIQEAVPCGDGEVEVPIDALDTLTLRKLQKFIAENVVPEKKKRVSLSRMSSVDRDQPPAKRPRKPRTPKSTENGATGVGLSTDFQDDADLGLFDNNDDLLFETGSLDEIEGHSAGVEDEAMVHDSVMAAAAASQEVRVDDYASEMLAEYEASLKANNNIIAGSKIDENAWLNGSNGHNGNHLADEDEDDENLWTEAAAEMQATKKARYDNASFEV